MRQSGRGTRGGFRLHRSHRGAAGALESRIKRVARIESVAHHSDAAAAARPIARDVTRRLLVVAYDVTGGGRGVLGAALLELGEGALEPGAEEDAHVTLLLAPLACLMSAPRPLELHRRARDLRGEVERDGSVCFC